LRRSPRGQARGGRQRGDQADEPVWQAHVDLAFVFVTVVEKAVAFQPPLAGPFAVVTLFIMQTRQISRGAVMTTIPEKFLNLPIMEILDPSCDAINTWNV